VVASTEEPDHHQTVTNSKSARPYWGVVQANSFKCEVVAVGSELLLGQIVDTNSSWIGEQLATAGIDSYYQTKVGDNFDRMKEVFSTALDRSDAVIVTGGLGPTQDDITRNVIADLMGAELVRNQEIVDRIAAMFGNLGRQMPQNNLLQADVPAGGQPIPVQPGTAAGLACPVKDSTGTEKVIYAVPGVPWEMKKMVAHFVLGDLKERAGITSVIKSRTLRTWGMSESGLAERLAEEIERIDVAGSGATIAFNASGIEGLKLRLTAKGESEADADRQLADEESRIRAIIGNAVIFGTDEQTMEHAVLKLCREQGLTLGLAESLTGGLIGARITAVPGSSDVFRGSIVSYASEVKAKVLGVPDLPDVSQEAVEAMALGACESLGSDCAVAVTGVAGPEPWQGIKPGTVWMASAIDGDVQSSMVTWPFDRERTRQFTVINALNGLRLRLLDGA